MLKLSMFEFVVRSIPEVFIFMFAIYAFSKTKIDKRKYLGSAMLLGVCVFGIRMLPINYGVHTILNIILTIVITCNINKIDVIKSIKASIIMIIVLFTCEGLNVAMLGVVYGAKLEEVLENPMSKTLAGLPSLIVFGLFTLGYYMNLKKKDKLAYV